MFVCLAKGSLPWAGVQAKDWVKNQKILEMKEEADPHELAEGLPPTFGDFLAAVQELGFSDRPDYDLYLDMFEEERLRISELQGKTIEEHDVAWFGHEALGDSGAPEPRAPRAEVRQPDDQRWSLRRSMSRVSVSSRMSVSRMSDASRRSLGDDESPEGRLPSRAKTQQSLATRDVEPAKTDRTWPRDPRKPSSRRWFMCGNTAKVAEPSAQAVGADAAAAGGWAARASRRAGRAWSTP